MDRKKILIGHKSKRALPKNFNQEDIKLFSHELSRSLPEVSIIEEENVTIHKGFRVLNSLNQELNEFSSVYNKTQGVKARILNIVSSLLLKRKTYKGLYFWATDQWSNGFFHWVMDTLPRILCLKEQLGSGKLLLPEEYKAFDFIGDSLKPFDLEIVYYKPPVKVEKLVTCSYLAPTGNYNPEILSRLRKKFLEFYSIAPGSATQNIYISRGKAARRKVINEDEVLSVLREYDFKVVYLEDYTWEEKVKLMASVNNVVSIHGAGLTNCLFMREGNNMLELRKTGDQINNAYFSLANDLKLNYYYLQCSPINQEGNEFDLLVDKEALHAVVQQMLVYSDSNLTITN